MSLQYPSTRAPVSITTSSPAAMTRSPGMACAWAPWAPAATIAGKASPSAPSRWYSARRSQATSASRRPTRPRRHDSGQRLVGQRARAPHDVDLGGVLDHAQAAHAAADVAQAAAMPAAQPAVLLVAQRRALEAEPRLRAQPLRRRGHGVGDQVGADDLDQLEAGGLLAHLLPVARVGADQGGIAADDEQCVSSPRNPER